MRRRKVDSAAAPIEAVRASAYTIPTDQPESDGTLEWRATTLVLVQVRAAQAQGTGYSYADAATARLIQDALAELVVGGDAFATGAHFAAMVRRVRNLGRSGVAQMAISAVDTALWDLKARLLGLPLVTLLGQVRARVPAYGSGGFTSYRARELAEQLGGWAAQGLMAVKMKVGRSAKDDPARVAVARQAVGPDVELFVDANGGYQRKQALALARVFYDQGVSWLEEPVPADDLGGLRLLRDQGPPGMDIAAGEYGYDPGYFRRLLEAGAVDCLQADATRCGLSGLLAVGALCEAFGLDLSTHCAPSLHLHPACALPRLRHLEYFHDHVRIEHLLFDGPAEPQGGCLAPDLARPGMGLEFKHSDAGRFAA